MKRYVLIVQSQRAPFLTELLRYATAAERERAAEEYRRIGYRVERRGPNHSGSDHAAGSGSSSSSGV